MTGKGMTRKHAVLIAACLSVLLAAMLPGMVHGAFEKQGALGIGARPLGMGNAFGAIADELSASYSNPAGLSQLKRPEITSMGGARFNGKFYESFVSVGLPAPGDVFFGTSYLSMYNTLSSHSEDTYLLSIAAPFNEDKSLALGINMKYYYTNLQVEGGSATGWGVDMGAIYTIPLNNYLNKINLCAAVQDVDSTLKWASGDENPITRVTKIGVAYWFDPNVVFDLDVDQANDPNISSSEDKYVHAGAESWFFDRHLGLRTGYTTFLTVRGKFTVGISGKGSNWGVDYAYLSHDQNLGDSHRISGTVRFGVVADGALIPNPPTGLTGKGGDGVVYLTWNASTESNIGGYNIYISKDPKTGFYKENVVKTTFHTVKNLTIGNKYYVAITAFTNAAQPAESNYCPIIEAVPVAGTPGAGAGLSIISPGSNGCLDIMVPKWTDPSVAGVNLYVSTETGKNYQKYNQTPLKDGLTRITGLQAGTKYFLLTRYTNVAGQEGPASKEFEGVAYPFTPENR